MATKLDTFLFFNRRGHKTIQRGKEEKIIESPDLGVWKSTPRKNDWGNGVSSRISFLLAKYTCVGHFWRVKSLDLLFVQKGFFYWRCLLWILLLAVLTQEKKMYPLCMVWKGGIMRYSEMGIIVIKLRVIFCVIALLLFFFFVFFLTLMAFVSCSVFAFQSMLEAIKRGSCGHFRTSVCFFSNELYSYFPSHKGSHFNVFAFF